MEIVELKSNLFLYQFEEVGYNILSIVEDSKALIIDTAFPEPAQLVIEDLMKRGIEPKIVILSHFHPDHICGSKIFNKCVFYGSVFYQNNLNKSRKRYKNYELKIPNNLVNDGDTLIFGTNTVKFIYTPGHSKCSITTIINNEYAHVGDLIMQDNKGKAILPLLSEDGDFNEFIASLEKIKKMGINTIIPVHGVLIKSRTEINEIIDDRLYYLKKVRDSQGQLDLCNCLKSSINNYENLHWHEKNLKVLKNLN
jgi:hydroxyacylglutathione hydrolase